MTNFQPQPISKSLRWLSPERAVFVLPIAVGLFLALALGSFLITPLSLRVQAKRQQVEAFQKMRDELPSLEAQLVVVNRHLSERREQQDQLLQLVAGVSELDTCWQSSMICRRGGDHHCAEPGAIQSPATTSAS